MTSKSFLIFLALLFMFGIISPVFAHSAKVIGDFKIETGWEIEPPLIGIDNFIEQTIKNSSKVGTNQLTCDIF